ncbi:hypothetical protein QOZ80_9AG0675720 [Eleusine coracana subsp. coracana]|nr:hypothetical protein QOZ80_9AG0675720 [Eleusine coracana subsp. coracana]
MMSYPCSPLLSFLPHEESTDSLWPSQVALCANATISVDPSDQQDDLGFFGIMAIDSSNFHEQYAFDSDVFSNCDERVLARESSSILSPMQENISEENSLSDLLLTGAEAVEVRDTNLASAVLSKLDHLLPDVCENVGNSSFDYLAYHFAQGLRYQISGASSPCYQQESPQSGAMSVHQMIQELSPFVKFAHFTTNQAILDATMVETVVHVIDFNVAEGVQWSSLMSDLARHGDKSFHLTAVITDDADYNDNTHQTTARHLSEFAESLSLPFRYNSVHIHHTGDLDSFSRNCEGSVIFSCDTTNLCYKSLSKLQILLIGCVKKLQPKLVVIVEEELVRHGKEASLSHASFLEFFFEALHYFTMVFESLASCLTGDNNRLCLRIVERDMVGPKIQDILGNYGSETLEAPDPKVLEGFMPCELSACNIAQARMLVGLFSRSFDVAHEKGMLQLCWKSRPLISVSVWTPLGKERSL